MAATSRIDKIEALAQVNNQALAGFFADNAKVAVPNTTIVGRATIPDLANDGSVRMGIERIIAQQIYQLQNEFGPNGEPVWGALNDDRGLIRFVGPWASGSDIYGNHADSASGSTTAYIEVTFYGTGLNLLTMIPNALKDARVSVDGGAEGSNLFSGSYSGAISGRNYAANVPVTLASNLSLGLHTVKVRSNADILNVYGFEILNTSSTLVVNPGTALGSNAKSVIAAQTLPAHNSTFESGTLAARGGRVVVYGKSDGTIGKAVQPTNSAQANLTSADHTNEEVVRVYNYREFGANRSDDFSANFNGGSRGFTLDDGTTTLASSGLDVSTVANPNGIAGLRIGGTTQFYIFTFVGTGLDILRQDTSAGGADTFSVTVDGTSIGNLSSTGVTTQRRERIVSGLPYGTHTVKILSVSQVTFAVYTYGFVVYQPKKPSVPSGAVELADYNVMATFVANTSGTPLTVSSGVLRKMMTREAVYVGAGWSLTGIDINPPSVFNIQTGTNTDYFEYTFFGTGIEHRFLQSSSSAANMSYTIDGIALNSGANAGSTSAYYSSSPGSVTISAAGLLSGTSGAGTPYDNIVSISALPLGKHTLRVTRNSGSASALYAYSLDVITPIHSAKSNLYADIQNTLPVGSQGVFDNRRAVVGQSTKAWAQAIGVASAPSNSSTTAVPMPDMSCTIKTGNGTIDISFACATYNSTNTSAQLFVQAYVDGVPKLTEFDNWTPAANATGEPVSFNVTVPVSAGVHKVEVYWWTNSGTMVLTGARRLLRVREF